MPRTPGSWHEYPCSPTPRSRAQAPEDAILVRTCWMLEAEVNVRCLWASGSASPKQATVIYDAHFAKRHTEQCELDTCMRLSAPEWHMR